VAFTPLAPNAADVYLFDIAHALSNLCRYGGHAQRFYSVAEHSVLLSYAVPPDLARWEVTAGEVRLETTPRQERPRPLRYAPTW
jgi:hypothetical protein